VQEQTLEQLLDDWKEEHVTIKEAIDQILTHVRLLNEQLRVLERRAWASSAPPAAAPARRAAKRR
jgi:hypothetical protein